MASSILKKHWLKILSIALLSLGFMSCQDLMGVLDPNSTPDSGAAIEDGTDEDGSISMDAEDETDTDSEIEADDDSDQEPKIFKLTVKNGRGDGIFEAGKAVEINAVPAQSGEAFDRWTVDEGHPSIADVTLSSTILTMPANNVTVTATYKYNPQETNGILRNHIGGYQHGVTSGGFVPSRYNGGFSMYVAAWSLFEKYPGWESQTGLFGTWMHTEGDENIYSDIEGGLGWWRNTRFATETPKFIMGGVTLGFSEIANGPGAGAGDWNNPRGLYGVAQLSPWLLFPPDGLNLEQGASGELLGYA